MVIKVCVNRKKIGLEFGLESNSVGLQIELGILLQSECDLVVGQLRSSVGIELDVSQAQELSVELNAVVSSVVVVEQTCLSY